MKYTITVECDCMEQAESLIHFAALLNSVDDSTYPSDDEIPPVAKVTVDVLIMALSWVHDIENLDDLFNLKSGMNATAWAAVVVNAERLIAEIAIAIAEVKKEHIRQTFYEALELGRSSRGGK